MVRSSRFKITEGLAGKVVVRGRIKEKTQGKTVVEFSQVDSPRRMARYVFRHLVK